MSSNPFGALDDSDDESPAVVVQQSTKPSAPKTSKPMTKTAQKKAAQAKKAAAAAAALAAVDAKAAANSNGTDFRKEKHHTRTGGRDTHGRNPNGPGHIKQGKREFDRRSGAGRGGKDFVKKNGAGAHNWGEPGTVAVEGEAPAAVEGEAAEEAEPAVPEVVQLTMEEYMALREAKRTGEAFGQKMTTKVTEVVDGSRYAKATNVQETFLQGVSKVKRTRDNKKQGKSLFTDVNFKFKPTESAAPEREERRGGGRGGRGGFRGGRGGARGGARGGRGGARGGAAAAASAGPARTGAINPNDASAFPALGA